MISAQWYHRLSTNDAHLPFQHSAVSKTLVSLSLVQVLQDFQFVFQLCYFISGCLQLHYNDGPVLFRHFLPGVIHCLFAHV